MYQLIYEDLTHLGGPMGTEHTTESSMGHFNKLENAKLVAEDTYGQKIKWQKTKDGFRSPDMGYVMFHIREVKTKD
jgi:hypothetical protein